MPRRRPTTPCDLPRERDVLVKAASGTFSDRGTFILAKLKEHDAVRLGAVVMDLYRDTMPDPMQITKFEWHTILAFMGASGEEIADVQKRMGRVWEATK